MAKVAGDARIPRWVWATALCILLCGCAEPLPPEHAALIGLWQSEDTMLRITGDGRLEYEAVRGRVTTSLSSPIKRIDGPILTAGVLWFEKEFDIGEGPVEVEGSMALRVDNEVLLKVDTPR